MCVYVDSDTVLCLQIQSACYGVWVLSINGHLSQVLESVCLTFKLLSSFIFVMNLRFINRGSVAYPYRLRYSGRS